MRVFDHCPANFWREAAAATVTISTNDSVRPSAASLPCHRNNSETTVRHPLFPSAYCLSFSSPMLLLPLFSWAGRRLRQLDPFSRCRTPALRQGSALAQCHRSIFFPVFLHGSRNWRRTIHPELEPHSEQEGPALFQSHPRQRLLGVTRPSFPRSR
jgi:hypothetical protein